MYQTLLNEKLSALKASGQYRTFVTLNRICGQYPLAQLEGGNERPVIVWCSNDYLGMSQHLVVRQAMHDALDRYGDLCHGQIFRRKDTVLTGTVEGPGDG